MTRAGTCLTNMTDNEKREQVQQTLDYMIAEGMVKKVGNGIALRPNESWNKKWLCSMNKFIKLISAGIIILALVLGAIVTWKIVDNIRQTVRLDLQTSFKDSLSEHGKR